MLVVNWLFISASSKIPIRVQERVDVFEKISKTSKAKPEIKKPDVDVPKVAAPKEKENDQGTIFPYRLILRKWCKFAKSCI